MKKFHKPRKVDANPEDQSKPNKQITKKEKMTIKRKERVEKLKEVKGEIKTQLTAAQSSTKSMGKFDRKAHKEERQAKPKRRKDHCHFGNVSDEVSRNL